MSWSIISSAPGTIPAAMMSLTVWLASSTLSKVDLQDFSHPCQGDHHSAIDRQHRAAEARSGAPRNHRQTMLRADFDDRDHLFRRLRQHHDSWRMLLQGVRVTFI